MAATAARDGLVEAPRVLLMFAKLRQHLVGESLDLRVFRVPRSFVEQIDRVFMSIDHLVEVCLVEIVSTLLPKFRHSPLVVIVVRHRRQTFAARKRAQFAGRLRVLGDQLLRERANFGIGRLLGRQL